LTGLLNGEPVFLYMKLHFKDRKEKKLLLLQREYNRLIKQGLEIFDYSDEPCGYIVKFGNDEQHDDEDTQDAYNAAFYCVDGIKCNFLSTFYGKSQEEILAMIDKALLYYMSSKKSIFIPFSIIQYGYLFDLSEKLDYIDIHVAEIENNSYIEISPIFFSGAYYSITPVKEQYLNREKTLAHQAEIKRLESLLKPYFKRLTKNK
jgi:hypothetical protein